MLEAGVSLRAIQQYMRHSSLQTTMVYLHLTDSAEVNAREKIEQIFRRKWSIMPSVADCLRQHAPAYLKHFADAVPIGHRKVIASITRCRTGKNFLFHHGTLVSVYKAKLADELRQCGLYEAVPDGAFVRGFVQHTLPPGFQKIRHYGWMSSNCKIGLDEVRWLVWLFLGWTFWLASGHAPQREPMPRPKIRCAQCGGAMRVVDITFEPNDVLSEHALAYLDSG